MSPRVFPFLFSSFLGLALVACTAGSTTTTSGGVPNGTGTSPTDPSGKDGSLGVACTAYIACCADLAEKMPSLAMSCDATKKQMENAEANGVATSSFEASCKSGVDAFKKAGYCTDSGTPSKPAPPENKKCAPSCTKDADCANSCPAVSGGVACCDQNTRQCYATKTPACPKPDQGGGDPPPSY